ncbi:hypothetical protein [Actinoallomurus iriomotensis]|uniref:hypothetical protein n=1 Tax=Actinoallomurus iriomotensis TaxID=478107 RepID=UPI002553E9CC|nr:hypothetical protein [Actinoallomurus iriomotensis]
MTVDSAKSKNRRFLVVAGNLLAAALVTGLVTACSDNGNGRSDSTSTHGRPGSTSTRPATQPRKYVAMGGNGVRHSMLAFQVYPEGGQVSGTYTTVIYGGSGQEVRDTTDFNGHGSDSTFQFDGLSTYGPITGTLSGDRTHLTTDHDFGGTSQWTIVSSENVFESALKEYAKRFEACRKKKEVSPCEHVH